MTSQTFSEKRCFVIMPISDPFGYDQGHFQRVYDEIIAPAVKLAGFIPSRADSTNQTHIILLEILKSIVNCDMAVCDISTLNPNVMYELGVRQMTKRPVVLIKDEKTNRVFDTSVLKDIPYDSGMRIDQVRKSVIEISESIINTYNNVDNKNNSLLELLSIDVIVSKKTVEISEGEKLILAKIDSLMSTITPHEDVSSTQTSRFVGKDRGEVYSIFGTPMRLGDVVKMTYQDKSSLYQDDLKVLVKVDAGHCKFVDINDFEGLMVSFLVSRAEDFIFEIIKLSSERTAAQLLTEKQLNNLRKIYNHYDISWFA